MLGLFTTPGSAFLDPDTPINWDWAGNRSLLAEWAVTPQVGGWFGPPSSVKVTDLTRTCHKGTPYDLIRAANGVGGMAGHDGLRPGGQGYVNCPGTSPQQFGFSDNVTFGSPVVTVAFWAYLNSTSIDQIILESSNDYNTTSPTFGVFVTSGGTIAWSVHSGVVRDNYLDKRFTAPATGAWHHYLGVLDNTTTGGVVRAWLDGAEQTLATALNNKSTSGNYLAAPLNFAGRNIGTTLRLSGRLDGVSLWARDCSAEATRIYLESRAGNPNRWNWRRPAPFAAAGAGNRRPLSGRASGPLRSRLIGRSAR